jgi:hypothetical protein
VTAWGYSRTATGTYKEPIVASFRRLWYSPLGSPILPVLTLFLLRERRAGKEIRTVQLGLISTWYQVSNT